MADCICLDGTVGGATAAGDRGCGAGGSLASVPAPVEVIEPVQPPATVAPPPAPPPPPTFQPFVVSGTWETAPLVDASGKVITPGRRVRATNPQLPGMAVAPRAAPIVPEQAAALQSGTRIPMPASFRETLATYGASWTPQAASMPPRNTGVAVQARGYSPTAVYPGQIIDPRSLVGGGHPAIDPRSLGGGHEVIDLKRLRGGYEVIDPKSLGSGHAVIDLKSLGGGHEVIDLKGFRSGHEVIDPKSFGGGHSVIDLSAFANPYEKFAPVSSTHAAKVARRSKSQIPWSPGANFEDKAPLRPANLPQCGIPDPIQCVDHDFDVRDFGALGIGAIRDRGVVQLDDLLFVIDPSGPGWHIGDRIALKIDGIIGISTVADMITPDTFVLSPSPTELFAKLQPAVEFRYKWLEVLGLAAAPFRGRFDAHAWQPTLRLEPGQSTQGLKAGAWMGIVWSDLSGGHIFRAHIASVSPLPAGPNPPGAFMVFDMTVPPNADLPTNLEVDAYIDDGYAIQAVLDTAASTEYWVGREGGFKVRRNAVVRIPAGDYSIGVPAPPGWQPAPYVLPSSALRVGSHTTVCGDGAGITVLTLADQVDQRITGDDSNYTSEAGMFINAASVEFFHYLPDNVKKFADEKVRLAGMTLDGNKAGQSPIPPGGSARQAKSRDEALGYLYIGGGHKEIWNALDPPGSTGRNSLEVFPLPSGDMAPKSQTCFFLVTLKEPNGYESTVSLGAQAVVLGEIPSVRVNIAAFPTKWPRPLEAWLYYRIKHDDQTEDGEPALVPLYRRAKIMNAIDPAMWAGAPIDATLAEIEGGDDFSQDPDRENSELGQWIPPGLGITHRGNGSLAAVEFDHIADSGVEGLEIREFLTDGIDLASDALGGRATNITIDSVFSHDNARAGMSINGSVEGVLVEACCFLSNMAGGVDIEFDGDVSQPQYDEYMVHDVRFLKCVIAGSDYGMSISPSQPDQTEMKRPYGGLVGLTLDHCTFYANHNHLKINGTTYSLSPDPGKVPAVPLYPPNRFAIIEGIMVTCCHFISSWGTACFIQAGQGCTMEFSTFVDNGRPNFPDPTVSPPVLGPAPLKDAPYYNVNSNLLFGSEIRFGASDPAAADPTPSDPAIDWTIRGCFITLAWRDARWPPDNLFSAPAIEVAAWKRLESLHFSDMVLDSSLVPIPMNVHPMDVLAVLVHTFIDLLNNPGAADWGDSFGGANDLMYYSDINDIETKDHFPNPYVPGAITPAESGCKGSPF